MRTLALPEECGALVANDATGEAGQDRRQGRPPWPVRHVPIGRGCGAEELVPENLGLDLWSTTKTRSGVGRGNRQREENDTRGVSG